MKLMLFIIVLVAAIGFVACDSKKDQCLEVLRKYTDLWGHVNGDRWKKVEIRKYIAESERLGCADIAGGITGDCVITGCHNRVCNDYPITPDDKCPGEFAIDVCLHYLFCAPPVSYTHLTLPTIYSV
eukprot:TRINITY_DN26050_c0_g2_i1.p1 TRINITY_DN26050_c0_g2~~TRINITY_DN26050_c0_g2_i1.p1  ORF type:complete len:127 (+),score=26.70 TRINITY_DN26050_c0_g2_i1:131-511(+)